MDMTVKIPRLSAYFAFGIQVDPNQARAGAASTRTGAVSDASTGQVIDITPQSASSSAQRNATGQAAIPRKTNIFLDAPAQTTYAPPARPGQSVRVVEASQTLGQKLDAWG